MPASSIRILALFGSRSLFGQERANIETLAALNSLGCEVVCAVRPEDWPEVELLRRHLDLRNLRWVKVTYCDYPLRGWIIRTVLRNPVAFIKGNSELQRVIDEIRPTHIHVFNQFYFFCFLLALYRASVPIVYRSGDKPILHNLFHRLVWAAVKQRVSRYVADSLFIKKKLMESGVPSEAIDVIYAPPPVHLHDQPVALPQDSLANGIFRFVYVGQIKEHKGVHLLVDAFSTVAKTCPQAHLLIVGPISDSKSDDWARNLRHSVENNDEISERIHFLGFVEDIPSTLRRCHAHVIPSLFEEPYGLVTLEAKQCAIPSIGFDDGAFTELVTDGIDGRVIEKGDVAALASAMQAYVENPALAVADGQAARESQARLGIEAFAQRWLESYETTEAGFPRMTVDCREISA